MGEKFQMFLKPLRFKALYSPASEILLSLRAEISNEALFQEFYRACFFLFCWEPIGTQALRLSLVNCEIFVLLPFQYDNRSFDGRILCLISSSFLSEIHHHKAFQNALCVWLLLFPGSRKVLLSPGLR